MKNRNGFTLVELLVCIGIVASLAIIIGVNINKMTQTSKNKENVGLFERIKTSAITYSNLSYYSGGNITIENLIEKGLLEDSISQTYNPLFADQVVFNNGDYVEVSFVAGEKKLKFYSNTGSCSLELDNIDSSENWGKC